MYNICWAQGGLYMSFVDVAVTAIVVAAVIGAIYRLRHSKGDCSGCASASNCCVTGDTECSCPIAQTVVAGMEAKFPSHKQAVSSHK